LIATIAANAAIARPVQARDDWQLWLGQKWSVKLSPRVKLVGKSEERFRDEGSDYYSQIASVGVSWKPLPWFKLEPGYHYQWTEQAGRDTNENRLFLNATPSWSWGCIQVQDRNRVEFRHLNRVDDWRYRNKPTLSIELGAGWYEVEPYVADEVFYGARAGEWNRNRFFLGAEKPLTRRVSAELSYVIESNKKGRDWEEFHVVGIALNLTL
jgi:hypothetical protein